jgi:hypothetical protein
MEKSVKSKQLILTLAVALSVVGCQNDDAEIKALQDLTAGQTDKVMEQNETLRNLVTQIETCRAELAEAKGEAAVIKYKEVSFDVPALMGEAKVEPKAKVETLEELKTSLAETLDKQAAKLTELKAAADQGTNDLATAKADAEKADAAAAAEGAAKEAAAKKAKPKKPTAVK